jgi:NhaA family Na+:H+ antiporter
MLMMNRLRVHQLWPYLIGGIVMWYFMLHSGVHATITGVLLAFAIPFQKGEETSTSYRLQHWLHKPVAFIVLPLFALANTSILINADFHLALAGLVSAGIMTGLFIGKPLGIVLFSYAAVKARLCKLPEELRWKHVVGAGLLGGIGFTMSIFITMLAFDDVLLIDQAKISIILISIVAGLSGYLWLKMIQRNTSVRG